MTKVWMFFHDQEKLLFKNIWKFRRNILNQFFQDKIKNNKNYILGIRNRNKPDNQQCNQTIYSLPGGSDTKHLIHLKWFDPLLLKIVSSK